MDVSITGGGLAIAMALIVVGILAFIVVMRNIYSKRATEGLTDSDSGSSLTSRTKYAGADAFKYSGTYFNLGLALAVGLTVLAFGWTQYEEEIYIPDDALELPDEIEVEPPRTAEP
ncbi:MAG: energy transducer TonB, partial [Phaeodactylibacter sp.]|nr:energy transducer TonB [Phaeodactylibacter sp.]